MIAPLITIGITCYREGDWLLECWESVLAQTVDRWEAVLVMDGGADERTIEIFNALQHPRLRKHRMEVNGGLSTSKNKAFELTRTKYHFYLDGDDKIPPTVIQKANALIESDDSIDLIYGDIINIPCGSIRKLPQHVTEDNLLSLLGAGIYKKSLWEQLGGFNKEFTRGGADSDFRISMYEAGSRMQHIGSIYYLYRNNEKGMYSKRKLTHYETLIKIIQCHPVYFANNQLRKQVLIYGYCSSISGFLRIGNNRRALYLTLRALFTVDTLSLSLWKIFLYVILYMLHFKRTVKSLH